MSTFLKEKYPDMLHMSVDIRGIWPESMIPLETGQLETGQSEETGGPKRPEKQQA